MYRVNRPADSLVFISVAEGSPNTLLHAAADITSWWRQHSVEHAQRLLIGVIRQVYALIERNGGVLTDGEEDKTETLSHKVTDRMALET